MKTVFIYPGYENLGIEYLSSALRYDGFETTLIFDPILFDENGFIKNKYLGRVFSFRKQIINKIINLKPDLICFSVLTDYYVWACNLASELKRHVKSKIIFGGIHPTSVPERVITQPFVDYVCVGEGEEAIVDLAKALRDCEPTTSIENIWAKQKGVIFKNRLRQLISNINTLPFPDKDIYYSQFPIFNYGYLITTSRGCPFRCSYCCNNVYHFLYKDIGKFIRRRSIDNVLAELNQAMIKYKFKFIHFIDDVFNHDHIWLLDFLKLYRKEIKLPFSCYVYPDFVERSIAKELRRSGCFKVQMGVQIANERKRRDILYRVSSQERILDAINLLKSENIYVTCDNIFGFPEETEDDLRELAHFYNKVPPNHCESFWLRYYPKTEITRWALENKYIDEEKREKIENGNFSYGLINKSEHVRIKSHTQQMMFFLNIYPFIPRKLRSLILKTKFYHFFPRVPVVFLLIIIRIFNHARYDFNTVRVLKRYWYFSAIKLKSWKIS